jgi:hypothetical protein
LHPRPSPHQHRRGQTLDPQLGRARHRPRTHRTPTRSPPRRRVHPQQHCPVTHLPAFPIGVGVGIGIGIDSRFPSPHLNAGGVTATGPGSRSAPRVPIAPTSPTRDGLQPSCTSTPPTAGLGIGNRVHLGTEALGERFQERTDQREIGPSPALPGAMLCLSERSSTPKDFL